MQEVFDTKRHNNKSKQNALTSKAHELGSATVKKVTGATAEVTEEQWLDLFKRCPMSVLITSHGNAWFYHHWTTLWKLCDPLWSGGWIDYITCYRSSKEPTIDWDTSQYVHPCPCLRGWFESVSLERGADQILLRSLRSWRLRVIQRFLFRFPFNWISRLRVGQGFG